MVSANNIEEYLTPGSKINLKINSATEGIEQPFALLLLVEPKQYSLMKDHVVQKYAVDNDIIYITVNTGVAKIIEELKQNKIETKNFSFIDLVSKSTGAKKTVGENISYLESPSELTDTLVYVEKELSEKKKPFVVLDSVSTLLVYNDVASVERFVHLLVGKVNDIEASVLIFSTDADDSQIVTKTIGQFVDKTIRI
ncbi:MAG: hypothetical protein COV47_02860 [Candidatus Diapherotrites archaeon CG11_big_fil_rev_8_21_14_0_20_37_9]|nr:MAG: hypothetical protein COV47_02860 [Candidatus Diapherotrites archaeon CG11_big_fil_rev_8_21_14_0_20_37_9]